MWLVLCRFPSVSVLHDGHGLRVSSAMSSVACVAPEGGQRKYWMMRCGSVPGGEDEMIRVEMASSSVVRDLVISFYWRT
jgi:hypothetical protein